MAPTHKAVYAVAAATGLVLWVSCNSRCCHRQDTSRNPSWVYFLYSIFHYIRMCNRFGFLEQQRRWQCQWQWQRWRWFQRLRVQLMHDRVFLHRPGLTPRYCSPPLHTRTKTYHHDVLVGPTLFYLSYLCPWGYAFTLTWLCWIFCTRSSATAERQRVSYACLSRLANWSRNSTYDIRIRQACRTLSALQDESGPQGHPRQWCIKYTDPQVYKYKYKYIT